MILILLITVNAYHYEDCPGSGNMFFKAFEVISKKEVPEPDEVGFIQVEAVLVKPTALFGVNISTWQNEKLLNWEFANSFLVLQGIEMMKFSYKFMNITGEYTALVEFMAKKIVACKKFKYLIEAS